MYKYPDMGYGYPPYTYYGMPFIYPSIPTIPIYAVDPYMYPPVDYNQNMQIQTYPSLSRGEQEDYAGDDGTGGNFGNLRMKTVDISEITD
ncbi:MAG: hypothetical protein LKE46_07975 [Clostridium sp.]|jgi:hypothetical protein|uniref:hypothetical protein n=1 Tax=Clostridium sp. TaxID=1506 RepID=UPI0025BD1376|nr:hypothetical protein [Clostridium sp.]MCH3964202.1 hypothetical protein [Clostridium sp.]MCI1715383.1 hypothetical protein [Clostridium sp.]MCI1799826.1 hypothetical protein [Clostridium sp.]MCI1813566.1 hypothetical protein [Clostridium sp.]MCI1870644.1 hypothetical protein [Clostridium sp.]